MYSLHIKIYKGRRTHYFVIVANASYLRPVRCPLLKIESEASSEKTTKRSFCNDLQILVVEADNRKIRKYFLKKGLSKGLSNRM